MDDEVVIDFSIHEIMVKKDVLQEMAGLGSYVLSCEIEEINSRLR